MLLATVLEVLTDRRRLTERALPSEVSANLLAAHPDPALRASAVSATVAVSSEKAGVRVWNVAQLEQCY